MLTLKKYATSFHEPPLVTFLKLVESEILGFKPESNVYDPLSYEDSVNSSTSSMNIPEGLGDELTKMKATINELNAKYSSMLEGMNK